MYEWCLETYPLHGRGKYHLTYIINILFLFLWLSYSAFPWDGEVMFSHCRLLRFWAWVETLLLSVAAFLLLPKEEHGGGRDAVALGGMGEASCALLLSYRCWCKETWGLSWYLSTFAVFHGVSTPWPWSSWSGWLTLNGNWCTLMSFSSSFRSSLVHWVLRKL